MEIDYCETGDHDVPTEEIIGCYVESEGAAMTTCTICQEDQRQDFKNFIWSASNIGGRW